MSGSSLRSSSRVVLLLALGMAAAVPGSAAAQLFAPRVDYFAGANPIFVAIGDLNGDHRPDVVTANLGPNGPSNTVTVMLGVGDGSLGTWLQYQTGNTPCSVAIGDLNRDGVPDLVVANQLPNTVSVLPGHGDGTFGLKNDFATGTYPLSVAIGDLNGDGNLDVAAANYESNTVSVLLGNGTGSLGSKRDFGTGRNPSSVAIGDLNRDGKPDLVTADYGQAQGSVLLGNGDGSFRIRTAFFVGSFPATVAIGDLNGDGKLDAATANYGSNTVSVLLGDGNGGFVPKTDYGTGANPYFVAIGDLDSDGKPDLAVANAAGFPTYASSVSVLLGKGNGSFGPKTDFGTGTTPNCVAMGDLNGDFMLDLVTANYEAHSISVLLNVGAPTPVVLSLVQALVRPDGVTLTWYGAAVAGAGATVFRRAEGSDWSKLGSITADGTGLLRFDDVDVQPGRRYGYRLGVTVDGAEELTSETWIDVPPGWTLGLATAGPNPARDRFAIAVTLPSSGTARLEVFDSSGRRVGHRELASAGAGRRVVAFNEAAGWRPGVYLVRLAQDNRAITMRASLIR
jgi:hypothetical protein